MRTIEEFKRNKAKIDVVNENLKHLVGVFERYIETDNDSVKIMFHLLEARGQVLNAYKIMANRLLEEQKR